jgi:hypothetical protein
MIIEAGVRHRFHPARLLPVIYSLLDLARATIATSGAGSSTGKSH